MPCRGNFLKNDRDIVPAEQLRIAVHFYRTSQAQLIENAALRQRNVDNHSETVMIEEPHVKSEDDNMVDVEDVVKKRIKTESLFFNSITNSSPICVITAFVSSFEVSRH